MLRCRHQIHHDLPGGPGFAYQQMSEAALVRHPVIIWGTGPGRQVQDLAADDAQVGINDPAVLCIYDVIEAPLFVHPKHHGAALEGIPKRKFHLVAITGFVRRWQDSIEPPFRRLDECRFHQTPDLFFLQSKLVRIGNRLQLASAALREMRTSDFLLRRALLNDLQQNGFTLRSIRLLDTAADPLSRKYPFHGYLAPV